MNIKQRVAKIVSILDEKKAEAIEVFEMDEEYFVREVIIATTMGERHALSLTDELKNRLKPEGEQFLAVESSDEWVVIDLGDILIHLLSQSKRAVYNLEELLNSLKKRTN
ncbi:ribosome silencing factor [Campylobacter sp. 19-13652]|uniref:ribosome silencing factor n=1 Tax=Campylobacter sp. 19-13652 TaxID=2840180 RepID=UPI003905B351